MLQTLGEYIYIDLLYQRTSPPTINIGLLPRGATRSSANPNELKVSSYVHYIYKVVLDLPIM